MLSEIEKNGIEEKGHVTSTGVPYVTVIGDGGWAKRTYGHGYNSFSGVVSITISISTAISFAITYVIPFFQGFLLGAATEKPLFLSVRNKNCAMCHFYKSKGQEVKDHECF